MADPTIQRRILNINGINLFFLDSGDDKSPMICLHGRWGRGETWADLIRRYRDRFRIIAPDQRGHGLSDRPAASYEAEEMAGDIYGLAKRLGCGPIIILGHSMGGRVAANLAALYPNDVRALIILDETADGPETRSKLSPEKISPIDELTDKWPTPYATYRDAVDDLSARFRQTNVRYFLDSLYETADGYDFLFSRYAMSAIKEYYSSWFHLLPNIKCPTMLVRAVDSWCLPRESAKQMVSLIKNCRYIEIANSDHMVYADNPAEFYPALDRFLDSL